jgi:hypothetical protein
MDINFGSTSGRIAGCLERFSNSRALNGSKESGFYFHPSDDDLSPGTPAGKSHSAVVLSVYSNWRTAIEQNQNKRALTESLKGSFFLRKKLLGSNAFGVQLF